LAETGADNVAENDFVDLIGRNAGPRDSRFRGNAAQSGRGCVFEGAAEAPDGSANGAR